MTQVKGANYSLAERCRGCHAPASDFELILEMDPMPLAGMFCDSKEEALTAPIFPLTWVQCKRCALVQVHEDIADETLFAKYNYSSSSVPGLVRHFAGYADFLTGRYGASGPVRFLEIGCNDGVLLSKLPREWQLLGFDPSDVAARAASTQRHYTLFSQPFGREAVLSSGIADSIDAISGSNCLAHISDLKDVFEGAWCALRPGGEFWIEVHELEALLQGAQWDTIYHEHKVEWSEAALIHCLGRVRFIHRETLRTPMHGGALRICFEKSTRDLTVSNPSHGAETRFEKLREAYARRYETSAAKRLHNLANRNEIISAYGAAGRANVYLNQTPRLPFAYIIDEAPLRVNRFIPRVAVPIVSPTWLVERPSAACLVTAWNYYDDIVRKNPGHRGEWLTAFEAA